MDAADDLKLTMLQDIIRRFSLIQRARESKIGLLAIEMNKFRRDRELPCAATLLTHARNTNFHILHESAKIRFIINSIYQEHLLAVDRNLTSSFDFNIFNFLAQFLGLGETLHSRLIADLLNPNGTHGQGMAFLGSLLDLLGVDRQPDEKWIVTAELGRIDILLRRSNPLAIIIIENKSNRAVDQPNQLYRYWHNEIHLWRQREPRVTLDHNFHILYLTPDEWKVPNLNSLQKPISGYDSDLPNQIPEPRIMILNDLLALFSNKISISNPSNHRLIEHINQYREYWK